MTLRSLAIAALAVPLLAGCSSLLDNDTIGTRSAPTGGAMFSSYVALGTSIGAGIQSGGINDSTQKEAYTYRLATSMGLTPGVDWHYPSLTIPGCPSPYTDIRTSTRLSVLPCAYRAPGSVAPFVNNASVPGIRLAQVEKITRLDFGATDTLGLAQFLVGSLNPIDMAERAHATFITLEIGANDVLGSATRGTTAYLTRLDSFQVQFTRLADRIDATGAEVAVANVPNVTRIPHFTKGSTFFCLKTGACGIPATAPFSSPNFLVNNNCAPAAAGGAGDSYLTGFSATATIAGVLAAGGFAKLDCVNDTVQVNTGAGFVSAGPSLNPTELATINTRVTDFNDFIRNQATSRGWALVDFDAALLANAAQIPPIPGLSGPANALMGPLFSQDGIHPSAAGHTIIATIFKTAINAKFGTSLN